MTSAARIIWEFSGIHGPSQDHQRMERWLTLQPASPLKLNSKCKTVAVDFGFAVLLFVCLLRDVA